MQSRRKHNQGQDKLDVVDVNKLAKEKLDKDLLRAIDESKVEGPFLHLKLSRDGLYIGIKLSKYNVAGFILSIAGIIVVIKQVLMPLL